MREVIFYFLALLLIGCTEQSGETDLSYESVRPFERSTLAGLPSHEIKNLSSQLANQGKVDSALGIAFRLLEKQSGTAAIFEEEVDLHLHFAKVCQKAGADEMAEYYAKKAVEIYVKYNFEKGQYFIELFNSLGAIQLSNENYMPAIKNYNQALVTADSLGWALKVTGILNNIGIAQTRLGNLDSAEANFLEARKIFEKNQMPFNEIIFSMNNNLGEVAYLKGDFKRSMAYYETNYDLAKSMDMRLEIANRRMATSNIGRAKNAVLTQNFNDADDFLEIAARHSQHLDAKKKAEIKKEWLILKVAVAKGSKKYEDFAEWTTQLDAFKDSINNHRLQISHLASENRAELEMQATKIQLTSEQQKLELAGKERRLNLWIALSVFSIGSFLIFFVIKRNQKLATDQKLAEAEIRAEKLRGEKLRLELRNQTKDLTELSSQIAFFRKVNKETKERLKVLPKLKQDEQIPALRELSAQLTVSVHEDQVRKELQENLSKINSTFYEELDARSTENLSKAEKELCALFRLNLTDNHIAQLKSVSTNAIQVARYRIRRKLSLPKKDDLSKFLGKL